jgi:ketosteroid isomerase-like protein
MSQENVEMVQRIYDAVARHDDVSPFEVYAEDIVWDLSNARRTALGIEPVYHGHEGVRQFWRDGLAVFGEVHLEVEELIDAGDEVVAVTREHGVGRIGGVPVGGIAVSVWTFAEGKVIHMRVFDDRQQALEAVNVMKKGPPR